MDPWASESAADQPVEPATNFIKTKGETMAKFLISFLNVFVWWWWWGGDVPPSHHSPLLPPPQKVRSEQAHLWGAAGGAVMGGGLAQDYAGLICIHRISIVSSYLFFSSLSSSLPLSPPVSSSLGQATPGPSCLPPLDQAWGRWVR